MNTFTFEASPSDPYDLLLIMIDLLEIVEDEVRACQSSGVAFGSFVAHQPARN